MRQIFVIASLFIVSLISCKKSNGPATTPPPTGGSTGPGGSGGGAITSVSPLFFYPGDVITITGSGFNPDKTKDTVYLGTTISNQFAPLISYATATKILKASPTEIQFAVDSSFSLYFAATKVALMVNPNSQKVFTQGILDYKALPSFKYTYTDPFFTACGAVHTGDSIFLTGTGLYPPLTVTIGGIQASFVGDPNGASAHGFLPLGFFGELHPIDCTDAATLVVKVVNADGRICQSSGYFYQAPNMQLGGGFDAGSYSKSQTNTALLNMDGYALRDDLYMELTYLDNADGTTFSESIALNVGTGYPNKSTVSIDLGNFPTPKSGNGATVSNRIKIGSSSSYTGFAGTAFILFQ